MDNKRNKMNNNELKQKFLEQIGWEQMIEDVVLGTATIINITEEQFKELLQNTLDNYDLDSLCYNIFLSFFGNEEEMKKYMELEIVAREAFDSYFYRLKEVVLEGVNTYLPEKEKLDMERPAVH
jgi:hypothetical protein